MSSNDVHSEVKKLNLNVGIEYDVKHPTSPDHTRAKIVRHFTQNGVEMVNFVLLGLSFWSNNPKWENQVWSFPAKKFITYIIEDIGDEERL